SDEYSRAVTAGNESAKKTVRKSSSRRDSIRGLPRRKCQVFQQLGEVERRVAHEWGNDAAAGDVQEAPQESEESNRDHGVVALVGMPRAEEHAVDGDASQRAAEVLIASVRDESTL